MGSMSFRPTRNVDRGSFRLKGCDSTSAANFIEDSSYILAPRPNFTGGSKYETPWSLGSLNDTNYMFGWSVGLTTSRAWHAVLQPALTHALSKAEDNFWCHFLTKSRESCPSIRFHSDKRQATRSWQFLGPDRTYGGSPTQRQGCCCVRLGLASCPRDEPATADICQMRHGWRAAA